MVIYNKHFLRLLVFAALADWLISRTLARVAIFIPKTPALISVYQGITVMGQYASVLSALLTLFGMGWIAWRLRQQYRGIPSALLVCLILLSLAFLFQAPNSFLQFVPLMLVLGITVWLGWKLSESANGIHQKVIVALPAVAVGIGSLYHAVQTFYNLLRLPGPPTYAQTLFNLGELLVVLTPICLWCAYGNQYKGRRAMSAIGWGLVAALLFMGLRMANPAMAGILAIWSTGLTLYLPAPIYAIALGFGMATVALSKAHGNSAGWALLLLACTGYAPQLSSQIFLGLIALSLLAGLWREPEVAPTYRSVPGSEDEANLILSPERRSV